MRVSKIGRRRHVLRPRWQSARARRRKACGITSQKSESRAITTTNRATGADTARRNAAALPVVRPLGVGVVCARFPGAGRSARQVVDDARAVAADEAAFRLRQERTFVSLRKTTRHALDEPRRRCWRLLRAPRHRPCRRCLRHRAASVAARHAGAGARRSKPTSNGSTICCCVIITLITIFVLGLLALHDDALPRLAQPDADAHRAQHAARSGCGPSIPVLILVVIAIPSFKLLYFIDRTENAEMTLKVTGHQWYWSYEYPDHGELKFDSYMIPESDMQAGAAAPARSRQPRRRAGRHQCPRARRRRRRDPLLVRPVARRAALRDARPPQRDLGQRRRKPGVYYGQCNQICGINHAFMPIAVEALSEAGLRRTGSRTRRQKFAAGACRRSRDRRRQRRPLSANPRVERNGHELPRQRTIITQTTTTITAIIRPVGARWRLLDQPQGHRHDVPGVLDHRRADRRPDVGLYARSSCSTRACSSSPTATSGTC